MDGMDPMDRMDGMDERRPIARVRAPRSGRRGSVVATLGQAALSVAILGFFLWSMGRLREREMGERVAVRSLGISPDLLTVTWQDYTQYAWVERGGTRIGAYMRRVERVKKTNTYDMTHRAIIRTSVFGQTVPIRLESYVVMNPRFEMRSFQADLVVAGQRIEAEAYADPVAQELLYRFTGPPMLIGGGEAAARMALDRPVMLSDAIRPVVTRSDKLRVGETWTTLASDPLTGRFGIPVRVEVAAFEEIEVKGAMQPAFRIVEAVGGGEETAGEAVVTTTWYTPEGEPLRTESKASGLVLVQGEAEEFNAEYPELLLDESFPELDVEALRARAGDAVATSPGELLPWLPKM